jgi:hypothetical protein
MKLYKTSILFGVLIWLIVYFTGQIFINIGKSNFSLYIAIFAISIALSAALFSISYFKKIFTDPLNEGIKTGIVWLLIVVGLDLLLSLGQKSFKFYEYVEDKGLLYLIIPIITISIGYLLEKRADL